MTRRVPAPDLVIPVTDLRSVHMPKIVVFDEPTLVSVPARGAIHDELVVEDLVPPSTWKEGIHQIDVQHLFG